MHEACHHRKAIPVIPPRKGARLRKGLAFAHRNEAVKACKKLGRTIWKRWSGYHRRSLVETKMNCFKRLGEKVMARTFERQVSFAIWLPINDANYVEMEKSAAERAWWALGTYLGKDKTSSER